MMYVTTEVNEFKQTFRITAINGAVVTGHTSWSGKIFMVFVPSEDRRNGIAKALLRKAITLLAELDCPNPSITDAVSEEGKGMVEWFKLEIAKSKQ